MWKKLEFNFSQEKCMSSYFVAILFNYLLLPYSYFFIVYLGSLLLPEET